MRATRRDSARLNVTVTNHEIAYLAECLGRWVSRKRDVTLRDRHFVRLAIRVAEQVGLRDLLSGNGELASCASFDQVADEIARRVRQKLR